MKYDILLFDADNTILDFNKSEEQALSKSFKESGLVFNDEILHVYRRNNIKQWELYEKGQKAKNDVLVDRFVETFAELDLDADIYGVSELYETYLKYGFFVVEHAEETLNELRKNCRLYIVTNGVSEIQNSRMKGSGMEKYFIKRFVSEEIGFPKPKKEFFSYCFKNIDNFDISRTIIIGDSLTSDIRGGVNAGIATCWYNPCHCENKTDVVPDYEIDDLREILRIV